MPQNVPMTVRKQKREALQRTVQTKEAFLNVASGNYTIKRKKYVKSVYFVRPT
jgi:hypothetical protein